MNFQIFQHLESVIKSRIPGLQSLISKTIGELETELSRLGKPVSTDAGVSIFIVKILFNSILFLPSSLLSFFSKRGSSLEITNLKPVLL